MTKLTFTKLNATKDSMNTIQSIDFNGQMIEVKQYLPINEKLAIISNVLNNSISDKYNFVNPVYVEVYLNLEIIYKYTNITFTDKQKEDAAKLYDLLESNGIIAKVIEAIPEIEYENLLEWTEQTVEAYYKYTTSALGILEKTKADYNDTSMNLDVLNDKLANPDSLALLKKILELDNVTSAD